MLVNAEMLRATSTVPYGDGPDTWQYLCHPAPAETRIVSFYKLAGILGHALQG